MERKFLAAIVFALLVLAASGPAHALMQPLPTERMVEQAAAVVRGYVIEIAQGPVWPSGRTETAVTLFVQERLKGHAPQTVTIAVPGGHVGRLTHLVSDQPHFALGQQVVVFLTPDRNRILGQIQGKLTVKDGVIQERMIDADDYLLSIHNLAVGLEPIVDVNGHFAPFSTIDAYVQGLSGKFGYNGLHWPVHEVGLTINENCEDITGEGDAVRRAMTTWNNVPADFRFRYDGTNVKDESVLNEENEAFWANSDVEGAIAYTSIWAQGSIIVECDLTFLAFYDWSAKDKPSRDEMDVEDIAVHELGHFLSLLDQYGVDDAEKTMYGYAGSGETYKRDLHQDDKDGIIHIYGPGEGIEEEDPTPPPKQDDGLTSDKCQEIVQMLYDQCSYKIRTSGGKVESEGGAMDACDYGSTSTSWTCIGNCFDLSEGCGDLANCINDNCDSSAVKSGGDDGQDEDGGGLCG